MTATRFEGSGPVARYWLAHCVGFAVEGDARGTVEELYRDGDPHVTTRLLVRTKRGGRRVIPVGSVASVVPEDRLLIVSRPRPARTPRRSRVTPAAARARTTAVRTAGASGRALVAGAARTQTLSGRAVHASRPVLTALHRELANIAASAQALAARAVEATRAVWSLPRAVVLMLADSLRLLRLEVTASVRRLVRR